MLALLIKKEYYQDDSISRIIVPDNLDLKIPAHFDTYVQFLKLIRFDLEKCKNWFVENKLFNENDLSRVYKWLDILDIERTGIEKIPEDQYPSDLLFKVLLRLNIFKDSVCYYYDGNIITGYLTLCYTPLHRASLKEGPNFTLEDLGNHFELAAKNHFINVTITNKHASILDNVFSSFKIGEHREVIWDGNEERNQLHLAIKTLLEKLVVLFKESKLLFSEGELDEFENASKIYDKVIEYESLTSGIKIQI